MMNNLLKKGNQLLKKILRNQPKAITFQIQYLPFLTIDFVRLQKRYAGLDYAIDNPQNENGLHFRRK